MPKTDYSFEIERLLGELQVIQDQFQEDLNHASEEFAAGSADKKTLMMFKLTDTSLRQAARSLASLQASFENLPPDTL